ncbi:synaptopodin 2-like protein [Hemiscyllium ocellatum]|uniref:synaptopodin 2-like protein n=1 Tax=Hemiscyllium ocellatum TaxID=170820 RepID=UPI0029671F5D|nr:synaptopodin 2-like protein [Hemiscyllium ocellatum]
MELGADVPSYGYFSRTPTETKGPSSQPFLMDHQENHLRNLEDGEDCQARVMGTEKENGIAESLEPSPTISEGSIREPASTLREDACPLTISSGRVTPSKTGTRGRGKCRPPKIAPPVAPGLTQQQRPASLCRSLSASEQGAKDARIQSQKIAAQLTTPPSTNSKGVLLFNRRRKRVNAFTLTSYGQRQHCCDLEPGSPADGEGRDPGDSLAGEPGRELPTTSDSSEDTSLQRCRGKAEGHTMEPTLTVGNHEEAVDQRGQAGAAEDDGSEDEGHRDEEAAEEDGGEGEPGQGLGLQSPTRTHPVEINHSVKPARTTVEVHLQTSCPPHDPDGEHPQREVNGQTGGGQHGEGHMAHRPEEKRAPLANRTPKPFSVEGGSPKPYKPPAGVPVIAPYGPVYSQAPAASTRTSSAPPPGSSAPGLERPPARGAPKTGILEESRARRAARKPMFTFHEKPKVAPNPELLSLVQGIDVQKRRGGQAEAGAGAEEDDSLGLGAEAANFNQKKPSPPVAPKPPGGRGRGSGSGHDRDEPPVPEWASCLKPPELRAPRASQALAEVKGKGAELFARRQTRMERYTIEAPVAMETRPRPPSPTMSLPPSWKCGDDRPGPGPGPGPGPSPSLGRRSPVSAFAQVGKANGNPGPARRQQLSSSLFIITPEKSPLSSLPRGAPSPPRLVRPNPGQASYLRQSSVPLSSCPPTAAKPPPASASSRLNGFAEQSPAAAEPPLPLPGPSSSSSSSPSPRAAREVPQAPRPSFSARKAGLEPQGPVSPGSSLWKASFERRLSSPRLYTDTFRTPPESPRLPFSPGSSSISPGAGGTAYNNWSPLGESKASPGSNPESRRLKELLAKNVLSAARRKKLSSPPASPGELPPSPRSPHSPCPSPQVPLSPSVVSPDTPVVRSPLRLYRRSLTDSEFSLASDDSGPRSPSYYNFCPRGWTGSKLRQSEQL